MNRIFNIDISEAAPFLERLFKTVNEIAPVITQELLHYMGVQAQRIWINEIYEAPADRHKGWGIKAGEAIKYELKQDGVRIYADEQETDPRSGQKRILFVNIIEDGIRSWSIKDALLKSKRARLSQSGEKYIRVPFRYRIPGTQKPHTLFQGVMPTEVYKIAKGGGKITIQDYGNLGGMTRVGREGHYSYFVFRTVSEKSQGWEYPAISPTPVYEKVLSQIEKMLPAVIENFCAGIIDRFGEKAK